MKEQLKFKTSINCGGCVASVTPTLNRVVGEGNWQVDTANPDKVLTVAEGNISSSDIVEAVEKAGYRIAPLAD